METKYTLKGRASDRSVAMNGSRLPLYTNIRNHSPDGFNWGYGGSGPAQLALAVMVHHNVLIGKPATPYGRYQDFKFEVIASLPMGKDFEIEVDLTPYLNARP